jgi:hypothetical protein
LIICLDYAEYKAAGKGLSSFARIDDDGRIIISLDLKQKLPDLPKDYAKPVEEFALDEQTWRDVPQMNIVIMIVGSRGTLPLYILGGDELTDLKTNSFRRCSAICSSWENALKGWPPCSYRHS